jgi:hypothetical protein
METENFENPTTNKKSSLLKGLGLIILVIFLGAAAFVGGQLLNRQANPQAGGPNGPGLFLSGGPGGNTAGSSVELTVELKVTPAAELPTRQPDANGLYVSREDNSLFIGTGQITMIVSDEGGASSEFDGPVVEVVVTGQTQVYKEVIAPPAPPAEGVTEQVIQQKVAEGTIEEIGTDSNVTVWGRKVGDRIIADILVYSEPVIFSLPAP